jgi:hypothetical protein
VLSLAQIEFPLEDYLSLMQTLPALGWKVDLFLALGLSLWVKRRNRAYIKETLQSANLEMRVYLLSQFI